MVAALDLHTDSYAHVDPTTMTRFKTPIRKYPHAFYLPGTSLNTIKGFNQNIHTGDSPPVYRLPYRKSPHELATIKDELRKMLKLHIIRPSFSTWGAPCILVRKPLEKGIPQPLGLWWITGGSILLLLGMAIPYHLFQMFWMPLVEAKLLPI